ncbi:MAG: SDR family oxidoreductase [bacterium]|nr:SDR family oxidoreductase [bacterium]
MQKFGVVTGASTGIGQAISVELAKNGIFVALVARTVDRLEKTKSLVERVGGKAEIFPTDLSKIESVNELISKIKAKTNQVAVLVNVAGIWHGESEVFAGKDLEEFPQEVILDTYTVGITAPTLLSHGLIPLMKPGSKIINISGTFESGAKGWVPYYVSKRAIEDLTIGLAEELKKKGIQVNCVSPSDTATEAYKKYYPQYIEDSIAPEEIAKFVAKLYSQGTTGKIFVIKKNKTPFVGFHK